MHFNNYLPSLRPLANILVGISLFIPAKGEGAQKNSICEVCRSTQIGTPFYCGIKPDLPQCIIPVCLEECEVPKENRSPSRERKGSQALRRIRRKAHRQMSKSSRKSHSSSLRRKKGNTKLKQSVSVGKTKVANGKPYDGDNCELNSPNLKRLGASSKYIEYRPLDNRNKYQIEGIYETAKKYGLAMAEFRHPMEWWAVEQSSILETLSSHSPTPGEPKLLYAIGLKEYENQSQTHFNYLSDGKGVTFAVMDPRILGRSDEKCAVLDHVLTSDKRHHLTMRFYSCNASLGDDKHMIRGLLMFPPGSICYRRSDEECGLLQHVKHGNDADFHSMIQIGQTLKRFIYLYTDQMSWSDSKAFCEAKGLRLLDLDPVWDDGVQMEEVIELFLLQGKLNPISMFWTSGRFDNTFTDGKFRWTSTNTEFNTSYKTEASSFPFSWWDDQELKDKPHLHRRNTMKQPCVALALNPDEQSGRPKLNFKAWYCDFPMSFLCYTELSSPDKLNDANPPLKKSRPDPAPDSCELPPKPVPVPEKPEPKKQKGHVAPDAFEPFDKKTCRSKSLTVKRLTENSKFARYEPTEKNLTVENIKERCKKFGLLPAEIRVREDWDSISTSDIIRSTSSSKDNSSTKYLFVIGMDDTKETGKIRYNSDAGELSFSMFTGDGSTSNDHRCSVLDSATAPGNSHGLVMNHVDCKKGVMAEDKVAYYGLCMFPHDWDCYKKSKEETAASRDTAKHALNIQLGTTDSRSIFFNPVQRNWDGALKYCQSKSLQLLDFDEKWNDIEQVRQIFKDKLEKDGGLFPLTPLWTSGKLLGQYKDKTGAWSTTNTSLPFPSGATNYKWMNLDHPNLAQIREGSIQNACVEGSIHPSDSVIRFRPDYCDLPKYFLCYRKSDERKEGQEKKKVDAVVGREVLVDVDDDVSHAKENSNDEGSTTTRTNSKEKVESSPIETGKDGNYDYET